MTEPIQIIDAQRPDVTVIVVNYNTGYLFDRMMSALEASRGDLRFQIIVVDNASRDDSVELLRSRYPDVELITNSINVGFGRANNQALAHATGQFILLLNTDAFVSPDTLGQTLDFMKSNASCGILGVKLVDEDGALQPSCRYFLTPWNVFLTTTGLGRFFPGTRLVDDMSWDHNSVRICDWVPGCYYLTRREVVQQVGLFDPRYFLYCEEVDHCRRVQMAGWNIIYYPYTKVVHIGGESAKLSGNQVNDHRQISKLQIESELLYFRKFYGRLGLAASIGLTILADSAFAIKRLIHRRETNRAKAAIKHAASVVKTLIDTDWATHPTR